MEFVLRHFGVAHGELTVPSLTLGNELDPNGISSVPAEVARYIADPWVHDQVSVRLGNSMLREAPTLAERARAITLPALLWHGDADPLVDLAGTHLLTNGLGSAHKVVFECAGSRHECHHETPERVERLFDRIRTWVRPRIQT